MQKYQNNVQTLDGRAIVGASVTVTTYPGGAPATVYNANGSGVIVQPILTNGDGEFAFYAANGRYQLNIMGGGISVAQNIQDIVLFDPDDGLTSAGVNYLAPYSGAVIRTQTGKNSDIASVLDFGAPTDGVSSADAAFALAAAYSVSSGKPVLVPAPYTFVLNSSTSTAGSFVVEKGATITQQSIASSPGTGGGNLAFSKSRYTQANYYGDESVKTFGAAYGRNILQNPYFAVWPDLDVFGGTSVTAPNPTIGDAATYSGTGGLRVYGPSGWWGKVWGGAFDAADTVTNPGSGTVTLQRVRYGSTGEINETPWFLRWSLTGWQPRGATYQDPVQPSGLDTGTNSVEIAQVIRGARRYGKFKFRMRARYVSGDTTFNARLVYSFGTGGSPSPNAQINMQGFTFITTPGSINDYICMFEVPQFTVDANGDPIVFGTNDDDYCQLTITSGDNDNFVYDIFAIELSIGWGFADFEQRPIAVEKRLSEEDYKIHKVGFFGPTTNGAQVGQVVTLQPYMRDNPTIAFRDVVFNASNVMRMGVTSIAVTSNGYGYTSNPTVAITGGGGSGATATAALGVVQFIKVTNGGSGYSSAPTVVFAGGGGGTGAAATATVSGGVVQYITMTNKGTGYTAPPTISFSGGGGGVGAAATAFLGIETITVTANGSAYTSVPTVSITGGGGGKGASGAAVLDVTAISGDRTGYLFGVLAATTGNGSRFIGRSIANGRRVKT